MVEWERTGRAVADSPFDSHRVVERIMLWEQCNTMIDRCRARRTAPIVIIASGLIGLSAMAQQPVPVPINERGDAYAPVVPISPGVLDGFLTPEQMRHPEFRGKRDALNLRIRPPHLQEVIHLLDLSDDQRLIIESLFDVYEESLVELNDAVIRAGDAMLEYVVAAREQPGDPQIAASYRRASNDHAAVVRLQRTTALKARETFLLDFEAILTPSQREHWPAAVRLLNRRLALNPLESVTAWRRDLSQHIDLVKVRDEFLLRLDPRDEQTPVLRALLDPRAAENPEELALTRSACLDFFSMYEERLNQDIIRQIDLMPEWMARFNRTNPIHSPAPSQIEAHYREELERDRLVLAITESVVEQIGSALSIHLGPEGRVRWEQAVHTASYPSTYYDPLDATIRAWLDRRLSAEGQDPARAKEVGRILDQYDASLYRIREARRPLARELFLLPRGPRRDRDKATDIERRIYQHSEEQSRLFQTTCEQIHDQLHPLDRAEWLRRMQIMTQRLAMLAPRAPR